jgi:hypothetical protein
MLSCLSKKAQGHVHIDKTAVLPLVYDQWVGGAATVAVCCTPLPLVDRNTLRSSNVQLESKVADASRRSERRPFAGFVR